MKNVKGLEISILHTGWIENDKAINFLLPKTGTKSNPTPLAEWWRVPSIAVLIKHPEAGYIIFDGGSRRGDEVGGGGRSRRDEQIAPLYIEEDQWADKQLEKCGVTVQDLSAVIISHFHWDHIGILECIQGTKAAQNVYVSKKDFGYGLVETHIKKSDVPTTYFYRNFEIPGLTYHYVEEDMEFLPGIEFIMLEGHTPGIIGLVIHAEEQTYILPSDAIYTAKNYGPPAIVPGLIYDSLGFFRSVEKLRKIEKEYHAKIIFPHDPDQLAGLKTAPYFYK
jgi:glyoxylase-like metal-dependent hydrolase (beta-lactamase superfamily II)